MHAISQEGYSDDVLQSNGLDKSSKELLTYLDPPSTFIGSWMAVLFILVMKFCSWIST